MQRTSKYLYIIGGCALAAEREPIKSIERLHVDSPDSSRQNHVKITSKVCGNMNTPRRSPSCFLLGNVENRTRILIAGGCTGPNEHTDSIEIVKMQEEEKGASRFLEEKLQIGASCSGFDPETEGPFKPIFGGFEAHSCLDDVQVIDTATWKCKKLPKKLPRIKNSTVLQVENREFLMFGGWEDEQRTTKAIRRITFNEDFSDYTVEFGGFLPYPVEGHSMVRIGSWVLLIGGFDGCFVLDTIVKYDLETRKAEILPIRLAGKRENHVSALLGRFLIVAGGWNSRSSLDDVEVFEIQKTDSSTSDDVVDFQLARCQVEGKMTMARNRPAGVAV